MSAIATAIVGSAIVGGIVSSEASKAQVKGQREGMEAEERISERNLEFQREMAEQQIADFEPWRESGQRALDQIWAGIESGSFEVGNINLEDDPGYRVRMQEGIDALDASASARGRLLSGAQKKALTQFGQEQGSKEYANAYARELQKKQQRYNILSGLSSQGQKSSARQAGATAQLASTGGNIMSNLGRNQNIGRQNIGAIRGQNISNQGQIINQAAQNWLTYRGANPSGGGDV